MTRSCLRVRRLVGYVTNSTPFGAITQIAHSGAVVVTGIDGRRFTVGGSDLWGIDGTGTIYRALPQIR